MTDSSFHIVAKIPAGLEQELLQAIRDFDTKHQGCHFSILGLVDAPTDAVADMLKVSPSFTTINIMRRQ